MPPSFGLPISAASGPPSKEDSDGLKLLLIALAGAVLYHGGLLPFTHGNTYDAFIHMFFADSYHRSWFDVWEPRWYTGFATTSYPPGTHMTIAGLMHFVPLRTAFVLTQLIGLLLLTVGIYRFALLWVGPRPSGYAAIALILSSSISETIHLFGQLPTIFSLGVFLNGMPYVYRWIVFGHWKSFFAAVIFASATTAAHHVTTIFGSVLFVLPLGLHALRAVSDLVRADTFAARLKTYVRPLLRGTLLAVFMVGAMVITVFAYWVWSISDPITQVPIPHGSRENFLLRQDLGFIFFLLPWGTALLFLPYTVYLTFTTRMWPLGLSVLLCFVLGTGGTTPFSRAILGGAFDILTLDRFTFWATILILPFLGYMIDGLISGRSGAVIREAFGRGTQRVLVGGYFCSMALLSVMAAVLPTVQPTQPKFIDPAPITRFLSEDNHDRWRYLTLGFGDQFAYLSAQTDAQSIDGNYHSARRLPDLTRFSVERLENAKYLGVAGLGSLKQFITNAEAYHLKYIFSNDEFYDPLLYFSGWNRLSRMPNGVVVWEKPDISTLPVILPRRQTPPAHATMWGLIPPTALGLAGIIFLGGILKRNFGIDRREMRPHVSRTGAFAKIDRVRSIVFGLGAVAIVLATLSVLHIVELASRPQEPEEVVAAYLDDLDFRRFRSAYERLDPETRPQFTDVMFGWRWQGGLLASYGKLRDIRLEPIRATDTIIDWSVEVDWLTSLSLVPETRDIRTVKRGQNWYVAPTSLRPTQTPQRLQRGGKVAFNLVGRRQPRPETDLHRDRMDRPAVSLRSNRLVEYRGRYFLIGKVANQDVDPAIVSVFGDMYSQGGHLVRQSAGSTIGQRLLPGETSGYRVDFEGVLSLSEPDLFGGYDPTLFIPPELDSEPDAARAEARAQVTGEGLYRGIGLNGVRFSAVEGGHQISGLAVNLGTQTASVVRIVVQLLDRNGLPIWVESGYLETNIYPGQSAPFSFMVPRSEEISILADVEEDNVVINGSSQMFGGQQESWDHHLIPIATGGEYESMHLNVSSMTYDPGF